MIPTFEGMRRIIIKDREAWNETCNEPLDCLSGEEDCLFNKMRKEENGQRKPRNS